MPRDAAAIATVTPNDAKVWKQVEVGALQDVVFLCHLMEAVTVFLSIILHQVMENVSRQIMLMLRGERERVCVCVSLFDRWKGKEDVEEWRRGEYEM